MNEIFIPLWTASGLAHMSMVSPSSGVNGPVSLDRLASQSGAHKTKRRSITNLTG